MIDISIWITVSRTSKQSSAFLIPNNSVFFVSLPFSFIDEPKKVTSLLRLLQWRLHFLPLLPRHQFSNSERITPSLSSLSQVRRLLPFDFVSSLSCLYLFYSMYLVRFMFDDYRFGEISLCTLNCVFVKDRRQASARCGRQSLRWPRC